MALDLRSNGLVLELHSYAIDNAYRIKTGKKSQSYDGDQRVGKEKERTKGNQFGLGEPDRFTFGYK